MADKTEAATPRRREESRRKGQGIGRSWEFSMGLTLGAAVLGMYALLPGMGAQMMARVEAAIAHMDPRVSNAQLIQATGDAFVTTVLVVLPLALLVLAAGVAGNVVSGGLIFSYHAIRFDLNRINPFTGMKRLFDKHALVRLGLSAAKLAILGVITWWVIGNRIPAIVATSGASASSIAGTCLDAIFQLGLTITILLAVVALADFVVQRRWAAQSIRMTKHEVKEEWKEMEGDPLIRFQRRRRARQLAFARMMDAIPTADVVITNPTTLAVALKYDSLTMRAPKVVAKGQRLMAERIKQIARENRVPIVEDKPLARALFSRPVGAEIPGHLYRAVARLLVLVHQARFGLNRRPSGVRRAAGGWATQPAWAMATAAPAQAWWADAAESIGQPVPEDELAARYGRIVGEDSDDEAIEVDETTLGQAMAEDELADLSPEELAGLDAAAVAEPQAEPDIEGVGNDGRTDDRASDEESER